MMERWHSEDLGVGGRIIMDFREVTWESVDWIHLVQNRWAFVNVVMNHRVA